MLLVGSNKLTVINSADYAFTAENDMIMRPLHTLDQVRKSFNGATSKADVLRELREGAASAAAYVRGLSDDQLDRTGELALAGGVTVNTQALIEGGVLIDHVRGHLASIRAAG